MGDSSLLSSWQNFYMIMGTAAATLTGLMFVATTLVAGMETHMSTLNAGISTYNTPIVVHFCSVLLLAGLLSAPWEALSSVRLLLGLFGAGMIFYQLIIMKRMWVMPQYESTLEDWLWYMALPVLANALLIISAFELSSNPSLALYIVSLAMILLLLAGIRNSWDNVTFLAIKRAKPADPRKEKKRNSSSNQENSRSQ